MKEMFQSRLVLKAKSYKKDGLPSVLSFYQKFCFAQLFEQRWALAREREGGNFFFFFFFLNGIQSAVRERETL